MHHQQHRHPPISRSCPRYDYGYINGGSPDVTGGFSVTVLKKAKSVVIAMVSDEFDEVISIGEGVDPHGGNVQLLAVALEEDYTLEDIEAGRLPAGPALHVERQQHQSGPHRAGRRGDRLLPVPRRRSTGMAT